MRLVLPVVENHLQRSLQGLGDWGGGEVSSTMPSPWGTGCCVCRRCCGAWVRGGPRPLGISCHVSSLGVVRQCGPRWEGGLSRVQAQLMLRKSGGDSGPLPSTWPEVWLRPCSWAQDPEEVPCHDSGRRLCRVFLRLLRPTGLSCFLRCYSFRLPAKKFLPNGDEVKRILLGVGIRRTWIIKCRTSIVECINFMA